MAYSPAAIKRSVAIIWPRIGPTSILTASSMRSILRASNCRPASSLVSSAADASATSVIRRLRRNASSIRLPRSAPSITRASSLGSTESASNTLAAAAALSGLAIMMLCTKSEAASMSLVRSAPDSGWAAAGAAPSCAMTGSVKPPVMATSASGRISCERFRTCTSGPQFRASPRETGKLGTNGAQPGWLNGAIGGGRASGPTDPSVEGYAAEPLPDAREGSRIYATGRCGVNESFGTLPAAAATLDLAQAFAAPWLRKAGNWRIRTGPSKCTISGSGRR